ncbi:hypothetical protein A9Q86_09695 [Flavobacteriales bacterium 33_180_T64]|nr:hypothetical protein A9Q86_09695 [Flavobacteriales bacterium 33_180_T64]
MIKFFRRIRQRLLTENKFSKYLIYAIGEIVLVMIGILLALQVNAWNQRRLDDIDEKILLSNIHDEFVKNRGFLKDVLQTESEAYKANKSIMKLIGSSKEELNSHNLDSLFYESLPAAQFTSTQHSISNIIQNGKLNIIKDNTIIKLIYQWDALVKVINQREVIKDNWSDEKVIPFIAKYISFKEMDNYGNFEWSGSSKLKKDYYPLFQLLEYENLLDNYLYMHQKSLDRYHEADALITKITDITRPYTK